jgi:hypothetical protein
MIFQLGVSKVQQRRRKLTPRTVGTIGPDPAFQHMERLKKTEAVDIVVNGNRTTVTALGTLERAWRRGRICDRQKEAGQKYRLHHYHGGLSGLSAMDLGRVRSGDGVYSGMPRTERQAFHRQQYRAAFDRLGPKDADFLDQVICLDVPIEEAGRGLDWNLKKEAIAAATERLRSALDQLRRLWGI